MSTKTVHPLPVRIAHWVNALAILVMAASGWRIYNASPLFDFVFPGELTLGGWLAGALQWHFAAMWVLVLNGMIYLAYGILSGHLRRRLLPISAGALLRDLASALRGRLAHEDLAVYNAAQKAAYMVAIALAIGLVLSGMAVWKPVQFYALASLMGDYEGARLLHFFCMGGLMLFVLVHVAMVLLVPKTFLSMVTGKLRREAPHG
jgi:thiosulfate reductase cytochrome b subunit